MSTCSDNLARPFQIPVRAFEYPNVFHEEDVADAPIPRVESALEHATSRPDVPLITEDDVAAAYQKGMQEGQRAAEARIAERIAQAISSERSKVQKVVDSFEEATAKYYSDLEEQAVHLSLAIAAKILHREAQVDPLLVAALAKIATDNIRQDSRVQVNIHTSELPAWREYFGRAENGHVKIELVADPKLQVGDCVVHSEVGSAALGISAQLKEIERGLFDLLAQRPKNE